MASLEALEAELGMPSAVIAVKIEELEARGAFKGIMIDDARGRGESGRSFVRVGDDEMRTLAAVINRRGRLTVAEVAAEANRVLQLSDGGEGLGTNQPEDQRALGCEAGTGAPSDGCPNGEERNQVSANPSSAGGTAAVLGSRIGSGSSGSSERS